WSQQRIEADISDVIVELRSRAGHREAQAFVDVGKELVGIAWCARNRDANEFGGHGFRAAGGFRNDGNPQRYDDFAWAAGRSDNNPSLDADTHRHIALGDG